MMLQRTTPMDADAPASRVAPHNIEAEQALLGAMLVNNEALDRVSGFLESGHFYDPLHAEIYNVASKLIQVGKQATPITMRTFFENAEPIDARLTVPQYLGRLAANATTIINAHDYGRTIYDLAVRRHLILIGEEMARGACEAAIDVAPKDLIEDAEASLYAIAETGTSRATLTSMSEAVASAVDLANWSYQNKGSGGLPTGLADLDRKLGGMHPSDLIIIAGRPSMGKTALVTNIARHVAATGRDAVSKDGEIKREQTPVLFFSLEMSADQLAGRLIAEAAEVSAHKSRDGSMTADEIDRYISRSSRVAGLPIHIDQTGGLTIAQMSARARRIKRQHGIALVVVDYLQLMIGKANGQNSNRVQELTNITTGLKAMAKELAVPVIALSQLSRGVESRDNKRPQLSDLRESGSIEQDADVVMFVYREEYYVERLKPDPGNIDAYADWSNKMAAAAGKAEVIIGKQRHGPVGTVELSFESQFTRFGNLAREDGVR